MRWRQAVVVLLLGYWAPAQGQTVYNVDVPVNTTCETALTVCDDIIYNYPALGNWTCLYFQIIINETTYVNVDALANTYKLRTAGPWNSGDECPDPLCYGDGNPTGGWNEELAPGTYLIHGYTDGVSPGTITIDFDPPLCAPPPPCDGCLPPFSPLPEETYIINAWTKQENTPPGTTTYQYPRVVVEAPIGLPIGTFSPSGPIIDGWQRIEGTFTMPPDPATFKASLETTSGSALFDDVRIFPADGSMKCYVYDPTNLRFVAELDERHFATFYEYDNEGNLVRVKKETERGIKTLKETRQNAPHFEVQ